MGCQHVLITAVAGTRLLQCSTEPGGLQILRAVDLPLDAGQAGQEVRSALRTNFEPLCEGGCVVVALRNLQCPWQLLHCIEWFSA